MSRTVVHCRDDVFGGAAQLEQPVLQVGEFDGGKHDGVLGQATSLYGGASLVGTLAAGLRAVLARPTLATAVRDAATAPGAVSNRASSQRGRVGVVQGVHERSR